MNYQEANEIVAGMQSGVSIKGASECIGSNFEPDVKEMYDQQIQALCIVLESAKVLHESNKTVYWKGEKVSLIEFETEVESEHLKSIGIEEAD